MKACTLGARKTTVGAQPTQAEFPTPKWEMLQYGVFSLISWDGPSIQTRALLPLLFTICSLFHGGQGKVIFYITVNILWVWFHLFHSTILPDSLSSSQSVVLDQPPQNHLASCPNCICWGPIPYFLGQSMEGSLSFHKHYPGWFWCTPRFESHWFAR